MSTTFRPYVPDQSLLLPPDVREWLPEGHLAHHVSDLVDGLDLTAFYALYEGDGRRNAPYEPQVRRLRDGGILVAPGRSGRGRWFPGAGAGNFPQHRTLCDSASAPGGFQDAVRGGGPSGAGVGSGALGEAVDRRDFAACSDRSFPRVHYCRFVGSAIREANRFSEPADEPMTTLRQPQVLQRAAGVADERRAHSAAARRATAPDRSLPLREPQREGDYRDDLRDMRLTSTPGPRMPPLPA